MPSASNKASRSSSSFALRALRSFFVSWTTGGGLGLSGSSSEGAGSGASSSELSGSSSEPSSSSDSALAAPASSSESGASGTSGPVESPSSSPLESSSAQLIAFFFAAKGKLDMQQASVYVPVLAAAFLARVCGCLARRQAKLKSPTAICV